MAHALHRFHHVVLLRQECVAQVGRPLNVIRQELHHIRKRGQALDAGIPVLFFHGINERLVLQTRVFRQPLLQLHNFQWVSRSCKHLSKHRVRVQRDWGYQRVKLIRGYLRSWLLARSGRWLL